jgi:D-sedoheptulose 7-phosphate isomerase
MAADCSSTRPANAAEPSVEAAFLELSRLAKVASRDLVEPIERAASIVVDCLKSGGKVLACGNGGSAADAQHFTAEIVGRFSRDRAALAAVTLSADTSVLTAVANDSGFEQVFARQVEGIGVRGDVLLAISTSGRSPNVLLAIETARRQGMQVIALIGRKLNPTLESCEVCIAVPSESTPRIQELHSAILHALCDRVESRLFPINP